MGRIVFDQPPWWQRPGWQLAIAAVLAVAAWAVWWTALTPVDHDPILVRSAPSPTVMARSAVPAPAAPQAPAAPRAAPAPPVVDAPVLPEVATVPQAATPPVAPGATQLMPLNAPPGLLAPAESQTEDNLEN